MIVPNPIHTQTEIAKFQKDGKKKFHVVTDFDKTLTAPYIDGKLFPAVISILRDKGYISPEYSEKSTALAKHYKAIEFDPNIPDSEKKEAMQEWWTKHFELLIKSGLNKKHLERIVEEGGIKFRKSALEFLDILHEQNVPIMILSASGVGDTIEMILEKEGRMYDNVHIITNRFTYDKKGQAISAQSPIIHGMNKDETSVKNFPAIYKQIKTRKNVLLIGDSRGDLGMVAGFKYTGLIKIGFLDEDIKANQKAYEQAFDIVLTDNADFAEINKIVKLIK